jgi:hypothetical protein
MIGEFLQQFVATVRQFVHQALVWLPQIFVLREAVYAFVDGIRDGELKSSPLMGGERSLEEALGMSPRLS